MMGSFMRFDNYVAQADTQFGTRHGRRALVGVAAVCACVLLAPANAQQVAPSVGTVYAERKPIAQTLDLVGRVEATDRVDIQARVKGYLETVLFEEGQFVKKG